MPISHTYKCIFVHIPKACGTSIEHVLGMWDENTDPNYENRELLYGWIHKSSQDLLAHGFLSPVLQHLTIRDLKKIVPRDIFDPYFRFAFVRNPWDRLVSMYHFEKIAFPSVSTLDFSHFLNNLSPFMKQEQYNFITDENGNLLVDFIGRFEALERDFKTVCEEINAPELKLPLKNTSKHKHYSYYYTHETRELVAELFKNDIRMFGYEFEKTKLLHIIKTGFKNWL